MSYLQKIKNIKKPDAKGHTEKKKITKHFGDNFYDENSASPFMNENYSSSLKKAFAIIIFKMFLINYQWL